MENNSNIYINSTIYYNKIIIETNQTFNSRDNNLVFNNIIIHQNHIV